MSDFKVEYDDDAANKIFSNAEKAQIIAVKGTLNTMAALSRRNAVSNVTEDLTLRNTHTVRNIQYETAKGNNPATMQSRIGATERADYLRFQEEGGTRKNSTGGNLAIPTDKARAGGGYNRVVSRSKYLNKIQGVGSSKRLRKGRWFQAVKKAYTGKFFLYLRNGIYQVKSFIDSSNFKLDMIYKKQPSAKVQKNEWLAPSVDQPAKDGQKIYNSQMTKLIDKGV